MAFGSGQDDPADTSAKSEGLPSLYDVLDELSDRFTANGALGMVLVDGEPLRAIEGAFGCEAYRSAVAELEELVQTVGVDACGGTCMIATGETGRCEILLMVLRAGNDGDFYTKDLPALARLVRQRIDRKGQRIGYPYLRPTPRIALGSALALRNPREGVTSAVRTLLEEARADADLDRRLAARQTRRSLMEVITGGKVHSVYEPIVHAKNLTVFGYEALARGPEGTELSAPLALFGLAEQEDLTFQLDCLCRTKAIEGATDFPEGAKLFMNIRPSCFHDPSFQPDALKRTLDGCGLAPTDVVLEISEQESIQNYEVLREARDFYGHQGFQFALDDTGAGYASLEAVMEISPEFIKVDRAFVSGIDEDESRQAMVEAFRNVAERTNAQLIGEGLDTLEELQTLGEMGIAFGQGWLFGKPTPLRAR